MSMTVLGTRQLSLLLCVSQVVAEVAGRNTEAKHIPWACVEQPPRGNTGGNEEGQLLDVGIRRDGDRAEDAESALAPGTAKWDEHLIEEPIEAPASASRGTGFEISELGIVVPDAQLVIAEPLFAPGEAVCSMPGYPTPARL